MQPVLPPRREFLVDQVAGVLRREIAGRRWPDWLPAERALTKALNVSRPTLRGALRQLMATRELRLYPRYGYRIGREPAVAAPARAVATELGLICPERIYSMPSHVIQLVDVLRTLCAEAGFHLEILEGRRFTRTDPGRFMPRTIRRHPKACWIPIMADRRMQQWFVRSGAPAVIYGNVYPDLRLPSAGIEYHACVRHATALLLAKGHRRIALITHDPRRAGEQESLAGFREAFEENAGPGSALHVVARPDDDVAALRRQVDRLLGAERRPTAFIVSRTHHYATVVTQVLASGRRIPKDISLICRGEDTFLHFLTPAPAFYRVNVEQLARGLFRCVLRVAGGATRPCEQHRVVPEFVPGESVGPCPPEERSRR